MNTNVLRLNQYIAACGICSRRNADELIKSGVVFINKEKTTTMGSKVDLDIDKVYIKGKLIKPSAPEYFIFYKPSKVISTLEDPEGRPTIADFLPRRKKGRLFPVGRLDWNSEGLMIITNDGPLAHVIMHPKFQITKIYHVKVASLVSGKQLERLRLGVKVEGKVIVPEQAKIIQGSGPKKGRKSNQYNWIEVHLTQGQYHIVRKIMNRLNLDVMKLKRVGLGRLKLGQLPAGTLKQIDLPSVKKIFQDPNTSLVSQKKPASKKK